MREIKFRALDKRFKKMDFGSGELLLRINETDFSEPMQYIGLKDRNRKECFEGDLVKGKWMTGQEFEGEIIFETAQFYAKDKKGTKYGMSYTTEFEILGNIYENRDLLK